MVASAKAPSVMVVDVVGEFFDIINGGG